MHDGGTAARSYWNGAYFSHTTPSTWSTADGPLYVGRSAAGASNDVLPGGVRFVLLLNRALTQSEVAAVARWSWETHKVGLDLMNFSPDAWTGVSAEQVYWTPPLHMQPLSSRTVRFIVNIVELTSANVHIVRFSSGSADDPPYTDRIPAVFIASGSKSLSIRMTTSSNSGQHESNCIGDVVGPSYVSVVFTSSSVTTYINTRKQDSCSIATLPSNIADTDYTRKPRSGVLGGFMLRSLQLLDYAMTDLEAQAPVIISVIPQLLNLSHLFVTVIGSPFLAGAGATCSARFFDGSLLESCSVVSNVEIVVALSSRAPLRPSTLLAVMHNGITFRVMNRPASFSLTSASIFVPNVVLPATLGEYFSCFLAEGNVMCSGLDTDNRLGSVDTEPWTEHYAAQPTCIFPFGRFFAKSIASGRTHSCFVHSEGLQCVGKDGWYNSLGTSESTRSHSVQLGSTANSAVMVAVGADHSCAIDNKRALWCWGRNDNGQLGYRDKADRSTSPVNVSFISNVVDIACGGMHTCALLLNGSICCFGNNVDGQLGIGRTVTDDVFDFGLVSSPLMKNATMVRTGWAHSCAIDISEKLFCWGLNDAGQLGVSSNINQRVPSQVQGISDVFHVSCGLHHTCAVTKPLAALFCWGRNQFGQVGDGTRIFRSSPVAVSKLTSGVTAVAMGFYQTCALSGNQLWCWGWNIFGEIGALRSVSSVGISPAQRIPVLMPAFSAVSANFTLPYRSISPRHSCAIFTGRLKCWGYSPDGELGIGRGTWTPFMAAHEVIGLVGPTWVVALGFAHSCAISGSSKYVFCWGLNNFGQVGDGTVLHRLTAVRVGADSSFGLEGASLICAGGAHSCAVVRSSEVFCWGRNNWGQIGDGGSLGPKPDEDLKSMRTLPTRVSFANLPAGLSVTSIACGEIHTCSTFSDTKIRCWGRNQHRALGDGTTISTPTPSVINLIVGASDVSCGAHHSCALVGTSVYCWGHNSQSQLGVGSRGNDFDPTRISISDSVAFTKFSTGPYHNCAISIGGDLYCWGSNSFGQLGFTTGDKHYSTVPIKVSGLGSSGVAAVICNFYNTIAVMNDGRVMGWGRLHNSADSGRMPDSPVPVPSYGVTMSSIRLSFSNPVVSAISNFSVMFDVGFMGARAEILSVVVSGVADISVMSDTTAQCFNFAAHPVPFSFQLSSNALGKTFRFTLPSAMRVVSATDAVQCTLSALVMPKSPIAAIPIVNVTTLDANEAIVEAVSLVTHPAIFLRKSTASVTVKLSSYLALESSVTATISFPAELARVPIRSISVQGMMFAPALQSGDFFVRQLGTVGSLCSNLRDAATSGSLVTASWSLVNDHQTLSIDLTSDAVASGGDDIVCTVAGFTNGIATPAVTSIVSAASYFANQTGYSIVSGGTFPAIFYAAAKAAIAVSNTVCRREFDFTVSVEPVTSAASVKFISITGLPSFSSSSASIRVYCVLLQNSIASSAILGVSSLAITLLTPTYVVGGPLICRISLLGPALETSASSSVSVATYVANGTPLEIKTDLSLPAFLLFVVNDVGPNIAPQTGHTAITVFGRLFGNSTSQSVRLGGTAVVGTSWVSDTSVAVNKVPGLSSVATDFPLRISIQMVAGLSTRVFTYSASFLVNISRRFTLPATGGNILNVAGKGFGCSSSSPVARTYGRIIIGSDDGVPYSIMEATVWSSGSSVVFKMPRSRVQTMSIVASMYKRTDAFGISISAPIPLNVTSTVKLSTTGSIIASVLGRGFGGVTDTISSQFGGTAWQISSWTSDTCIVSRASAGVAMRDAKLIVSAGAMQSAILLLLSYDLPTVRSLSSRLLESISVTGSNFGLFRGSSPLLASCPGRQLSAATTHSVCELELPSAFVQAGITNAAFSLSLTGVSRLDDVSLSVNFLRHGSNNPTQFILMKNKCACYPASTASFEFQVLPLHHHVVPKESCQTSGVYSPEDATGIVNVTAVSGKWTVMVVTGASTLQLLSASIYFAPVSLEFKIGPSIASSILWISDSSATMNVPGYQNNTALSRASGGGYGRNLPVTALVDTLPSQSSADYSYPDPVLINMMMKDSSLAASRVPSTGNSHAILSGQAFANVASSPAARLSSTACAGSAWISDTGVMCRMPSITGKAAVLTLSVVFSAVASLVREVTQRCPRVSSLSLGCSMSSGAAIVSVFGTSFGYVGNSIRGRIQMSATPSTVWASDSAVAFRLPRMMGDWSIIVSVRDCNATGPGSDYSVSNAPVYPSVIGASPDIVASTGSSMLLVTGMFGKSSASSRMSLSSTSCMTTDWVSLSSLYCKSSWGVGSQLAMRVSVVRTCSQLAVPQASYISPRVSNRFSFVNASNMNSTTCMFPNLTVCSLPQVTGFVSNASGFGAFYNSMDIVLEGRQCTDVTWLSDSAVFCSYPHFVSKSLFTLNFTLTLYTMQRSVIRKSSILVGNPVFVPKSPLVNTSLFTSFYWPGEGVPSDDVLERYQRLGRTSGESVQHRRSPAVVAEFFETVSVMVIVYINDTASVDSQIFMDSNFVPISKIVRGQFSLFNHSSGTDASAVFCRPQYATSITLLPETYAAVAKFELSFCSLVRGVLSLIFNASSNDEHGHVNLPVGEMTLNVRPPGPAFINISVQPAFQFIVGNPSPALLHVVYNPGSGLVCSRIRFDFDIILQCQSQEGQTVEDSAFKLLKNGEKRATFRKSVMTCNATLSDVWFIMPSKRCVVTASVPSTDLSASSAPFAVLPGTGVFCRLLGLQVNCESAGALIWSIRNASRRCLGVQLLDEEGNNASSTAAAVAARARDSEMTPYQLINPSNFSIGSDGSVFWCHLYSTQASQKIISIGVAVGANVTFFAGAFNVSSPGPPAVLSAANQSATGLVPGQSPPSINLTVSDAAGNAVSRISKSFVIRIFVRPRQAAPASRRLLQTSEAMMPSICPSLTYVNVSVGSPGIVTVSPPLLCTAGQNDIFYSVGEMVDGSFVPAFSFEFTTAVTVIPGPFESFAVSAPSQFRAQSYGLIKDAAIVFRDKGMNIVSGSAKMMMRPANASFFVYPSREFDVVSNGSANAPLPPFFAYASGWSAAASSSFVVISLVGTVSSSGSSSIAVHLTPSCLPGFRLSFTSGNASVESIYQALLAGQNAACASCARPQYDSWLFDAPECLTLTYTNAPVVVHSGKALSIDGIAAMSDAGTAAAHSTGWAVTVQLQRAGARGSAVNATVVLLQGRSQPITTVPAYAEEPASDYAWVLQLRAGHRSSFPVLNITLPHRVTVLDFSPVSLRSSPTALSHDGHASITVTGFFPSAAAQRASFSDYVLPALRNNSCVLKSTSTSKTMSLSASGFNSSNSSISFVCGPLLAGDSGPPMSSWSVVMMLSDGRESAEMTIESYCPARSFVKSSSSTALPLQCVRCPPDRSSSWRDNSMGEQSCVCNANYYGTFGEGCIACPKNVDGFKCALSNQSRPMIQSGYYIDYSRLSSCSEYGPKCSAIVKCPNPAACPGTTEKDCLKTQEECYDSESFGCTACCPRYYIENFVCKPCPPSRLPLILALCAIALILFAVFSSTFDFPPLVSVAQSLKIFLSSMQGFVSIRVLAISWPPIVLSMFDFTRFFTFNFDVIRPECTVDYTPQTKLVFVLIGPIACALFIIMLVVMYTVFKCWRISKMLQKDSVKSILNKSFYETALSVAQCLLTTSFCLKFSNSRMMIDGALWNALSPALAMRTDTLVLHQKMRRRAVLQKVLNDAAAPRTQADLIPEDWTRMQGAVAKVRAEPEFARSAKRFRLLIASALSIFVFTFQSSIESALSTFDCKTQNDIRFLRSNPKFKCSFDDDMYSGMVTTTIIGLIMYCVLLPAITIITLRSRWCREVYVHDSVAYGQMFGFLTSMYSKACVMWELVACIRKVAFVAIPVLVSAEALVQSVSIFLCLIIYTFLVLKMQPMASSTLNQIELLSCISVIVGCFSSIFFVVEYKGSPVLSGTSRDLAGLLLVVVCAMCVLLSFKLMWNDFSSLMLIHKEKFVTKWVTGIKSRNAGMCEDGFVVPLIALFYNNAATADILESKRRTRLELADIEQRLQALARVPWYSVAERLSMYLTSLRERIAVRIGVWRHELSEEAVAECLRSPEFEFLKYLHKLTQRMTTWRAFPDKHLPLDQLPKEFVDVKGPTDAPLSAYERLCRIQETADAFIPADMQRTMFAVMLSEMMGQPEQPTRAHAEYSGRLHEMLRDFGARLCDVDAIYRRTLAQERAQVQAKWWKRLWSKFWRRYTSDAARAMDYMATLDEAQVIDVASGALGGALVAHKQFRERHGLKRAAAADVCKPATAAADVQDCSSPSAKLQLNSTHVTGKSDPGDDLQMNVSFSSLHLSAESQAQAKLSGERASAHSSGLHVVERPKSSRARPIQSRNIPTSQALSIELQEVVVHGCNSAAGAQRTSEDQQCAAARLGPAEESTVLTSASVSLIDSRGVKTNKTIRALAPERKFNRDAMTSVKSARVDAAGAEDPAKMGGKTSSEDCSIVQDDAPLNPCLITRRPDGAVKRGPDGAVKQPSAPPPPPRSRSSSRIRAANGGGTASLKDGFGELSPSSIDVAQAPTHASSASLHPHHQVMSKSQYRPSDSPTGSRNRASFARALHSMERKGNSVAATAADSQELSNRTGATVRWMQGDTRPRDSASDGVERRPAEVQRSRSHSRVRAEAASRSVAADYVPIDPATLMPSTSSSEIAASAVLSEAAGHEAAVASERLSRQPLPGRQPLRSWDQKVKAMKEQFADKFEEC